MREGGSALLVPPWHTACYSGKVHHIKSHHILQAQWEREQVWSHHCADEESGAQGGWGTCPVRRRTPVSGLHPGLRHPRSHCVTDWGNRPHHNQNPGGSQLAVHNPSSVLYFTQLVLHYFPTVSRKSPLTNQTHGKQTAAKPFSFDWTIWNRNSRIGTEQ